MQYRVTVVGLLSSIIWSGEGASVFLSFFLSFVVGHASIAVDHIDNMTPLSVDKSHIPAITFTHTGWLEQPNSDVLHGNFHFQMNMHTHAY